MSLANGHHRLQTTRPRYISDPYKYSLSSAEKDVIGALTDNVSRKPFKNGAELDRFKKAFVYDTNAIEGSGLFKRDVNAILTPGMEAMRPNMELNETKEAMDVGIAFDYLGGTGEAVSSALMRRLHLIAFCHTKDFAGQNQEKGEEIVVKSGKRVLL